MTNNRTPYPPYRNLIKEDGTKAKSWNGKLHSWDEAALVTPEGKKEYYLYGIQYTHEQWKETKSNRTGIPFYKDQSFKEVTRF
jgi:hypothetical protein